jgi:hypothetical protein
MGNRKQPWHRGNHQRRARAIVQAANADPTTRCWQCGRTKTEHRRRWTAGHVHDSQVDGELRAECEPCNFSRGATMGNQRREPHSTNWLQPR